MSDFEPILDKLRRYEAMHLNAASTPSSTTGSSATPAGSPPAAPRSKRGGRRPGAGAPKGNSNSLKHGLYSRRVYVAALMVAAVPELQLLMRSITQQHAAKYHPAYRRAFTDAVRIVMADPELAKSIKQLVLVRFKETVTRIQPSVPSAEISEAINQSNGPGKRKRPASLPGPAQTDRK